MIQMLVFTALLGTQAPAASPLKPAVPFPFANEANPVAAERGRRIEHSVICRKDDRIAVTVVEGHVTAIQIDGQNDTDALTMTTRAIGSAPIAYFNLRCDQNSVMFAPYDRLGKLLGALTLRYRK